MKKYNFITLEIPKPVILILKLIVAIILVYILIDYIKINDIVKSINSANLLSILLVISLMVVNVSFQVVKWKVISEKFLFKSTNKEIIKSIFYGFTTGLVTPFRLGEYVGRSIVLNKHSAMDVTIATLLDKLWNLFLILFLGSFSTLGFLLYLHKIGRILFILACCGVLLFAVLFILIMNGRLIKLNSEKIKSARIRQLVDAIAKFRYIEPNLVYKMILFSFGHYAIYLIQFSLLLTTFASESDFVVYSWIASLIIFVKTLIPPIAFGELGIREAVSIYFVKFFGVTQAAGFSASIFIFMINILLPAFLGLFVFLRKEK